MSAVLVLDFASPVLAAKLVNREICLDAGPETMRSPKKAPRKTTAPPKRNPAEVNEHAPPIALSLLKRWPSRRRVADDGMGGQFSSYAARSYLRRGTPDFSLVFLCAFAIMLGEPEPWRPGRSDAQRQDRARLRPSVRYLALQIFRSSLCRSCLRRSDEGSRCSAENARSCAYDFTDAGVVREIVVDRDLCCLPSLEAAAEFPPSVRCSAFIAAGSRTKSVLRGSCKFVGRETFLHEVRAGGDV